MGHMRNSIDRYEIIKIGLAASFIAALKVWESMKSWPLTVLTFSVPILLYLSVNGIRRYYHWKALRESRIGAIDTMSGVEFEELLLAHYRNLGYKGKTTPKTCDYGADLVLEKDNRRIVVQAKRWKNVGKRPANARQAGFGVSGGMAQGRRASRSVRSRSRPRVSRPSRNFDAKSDAKKILQDQ